MLAYNCINETGKQLLPHWEFEMISLKWGLFTGTRLNNSQNAKQIGVTLNRIPQVERNSFLKIAKHHQVLIPIDNG